MKVECKVEEIEMENNEGRSIPSICVTCGRCDQTAEVWGTSERSVKRALMTLREDCEQGEENFYVAEE